MIFSFSSAILLLLFCSSDALLEGNSKGEPQSLTNTICANRPRFQCDVELDVPSVCATSGDNPSSCPIVFFLHGSGGTNNNFKNTSKVHDAGYIGVYPQGEGGWNTGPKNSNNCSWDEYDCPIDPDEGDFIKAIIAEIRSLGGTGNVYVSGSSNGAALAHRLAANGGTDLPIKGIVAKVTQLLSSPERSGPGSLNYNQPSSDRNTPAVSILSILGTADPLIPYEGGSSGVFGGNENFQLMSALDSMYTWATHNGCTGTFTTNSEFTTDRGDGTATLYDYSAGCPSGILVEHYAIHGGLHNAGGTKINGEKINPLDFFARVEAGGTPGPPAPTPTSPRPSSAPSAPGPTPPVTCINDATWHGKFSEEHTCDYVAQNPDERCRWENSDGVSAYDACAATCKPNCSASPRPSSAPSAPGPSPPVTCINDATWHGKFSEEHTCDYVAMNPDVRCEWENSDGVSAYDACAATCKPNCSASPGPSSAPSVPEPCSNDDSFTFSAGSKGDKGCSWLWKGTRRKKYCKEPTVSTSCPLECNSCPGCQDDNKFKFEKSSTKSVKCRWIRHKKNQEKTDARRKKFCKDESLVLQMCPLSCGTC